MVPSACAYVVRHDNIETIYKKLEERRDTADVTDLLKELHRIVNDAIRAQEPGDDQMDSKLFDMSQINMEKLRDEFARKVKRKASALADIRQVVERKLEQMLARNPQRMDYYRKYSEIIADYNGDKDRVTIEETFAKLVDLVKRLELGSLLSFVSGGRKLRYSSGNCPFSCGRGPRLLRAMIRAQVFQRRSASSFPAGRIDSAFSNQLIASRNKSKALKPAPGPPWCRRALALRSQMMPA